MEFECIRYEKSAAIATITLNRPEVLNALNRQMLIDMETALAEVHNDAGVKVLIITGEGRAFSTGVEMKELNRRSLEECRIYLEQFQETTRRIIRFDKPTIAAINGYALEGGFALALACDIRIAAAQAQIGAPEVKVGSTTAGGVMRLIQQLIGPGKARELLFTGESITGREAERIGLVNRAVGSEQLMDTALEMAETIAANSSFSIKLMKRGLLMAQGETSLQALMDYEIEARLACISDGDGQESLRSFEARKKR